MPHRIALFVLASAAVLHTGRADAQTAGAASRAEEEASRPIRLILEAARIRPKARATEPPPSSRPAGAPARVAGNPAPAAPAAAAGGSETPAVAPVEVPLETAPSLPSSAVATVEVEATPRSPEPVMPSPVLEAAPEPAPALPPPKLRSLVEPVTPRHLAGRLRGEVRVELQLSLTADGRVSEAAVTSSSHPQMNAAVLDAVRQWRYEPAGRAREHAVQVVLRPDG